MKHTVYYKLLLGYTLFGLLSILIINIWTSNSTLKSLTSDKANILYDDGVYIRQQFFSDGINSFMDAPELTKELRIMSSVIDARMWILDTAGRVLYDTSNIYTNKVIEEFDITKFGNKYYSIGKFYNSFSNEALSVIVPITGNFKTEAYLVIHQDTNSIIESKSSVLSVMYKTFAIIFLLSLIILIIFTLVVFFPIKKISQAAAEFAKGNLKYDGLKNFTSDDEIGRLGISLDFMAKELDNLEEDQKKFIANVSHDFRSPLTSIKGYVEAMKDGTITPDIQDKYLDIVLFETERLTKLTQSLLTLNAWDKKGNRLEITEFSLYSVIKPILASFEGKCKKKHITIDLTLGSKYYMVCADKSKIEQVIYNLLDNAIKFSNNDSTIEFYVSDVNDKIFIAIKDHGIGIPKDSLNKIWDRFYKTDLSRGKDKTGTGLGLSITREIILAHNENINVISTEGVGTKFVFTLQKSRK